MITNYKINQPFTSDFILVTRDRAPFGQHQESRPLARSNDIPVLNGFVNTIDWDQNQSDLSDLTLSMRRVTGSPWIADFRCWTWPEVAILGADQKEARSLGTRMVRLKDDFQSELRSLRTLMFINIINGALDGMRIDVIR